MSIRVHRLLAVAALAGAVAVVATGAARADQSYPDPSGDAGSGSDITSMTVRNDQAGAITIQVSTANPIVSNHALLVFIDADKNQSTGGDGDEYWMYGGPLVGVGFFAWNGSGFSETSPGSFSVGAAAANVTEFRLNRADLGNVTSFNFAVLSASIDESGGGFAIKGWDQAGYFTYDLSFPHCSNGTDDDGDGKIDTQDLGCSGPTDSIEADEPIHIRLGQAKTTPARPKAGKTAVVSAAASRVETGQALDVATVTCNARIVGGKALRGTGSIVGGRATCKFRLPLTAKKQTVRGQIAVEYATSTTEGGAEFVAKANAKTPFSFKTAA